MEKEHEESLADILRFMLPLIAENGFLWDQPQPDVRVINRPFKPKLKVIQGGKHD